LSSTWPHGTLLSMKPTIAKPVVPIPASTVILVRELKGQLQVYLLKRSLQSDFMPGSYVFPGGTIDPGDQDFDFWKDHVDVIPGQVGSCLGGGGGDMRFEDAMAHGIAAIRETFEEASVLMAQSTGRADGATLAQLRQQNAQNSLSGTWIRDLVFPGEWTLAFSALARWSHWITPKAWARRFDTRFLLAFMPAGQECRPDYREMTDAAWMTPEAALLGNLEGRVPLSPPTLTTLHELMEYPDARGLKRDLSRRPWGARRIPRMVPVPEGPLLLLPWDPDYSDPNLTVRVRDLETRQTAMGEPFSRLWHQKGVWVPLTP